MTQPFEDPRPVHERIAAYLRDRVLSGDYPPGTDLPSTQQLHRLFNAAPQAVQNAMKILKGEGLAVGHRGKGITVREHRQRVMRPAAYMQPAVAGEPYRWISEAGKRGLDAASKLLDVTEEEPPADVARALGLQEHGVALLRKQILLLDGEPCELVRSYYPSEIARLSPAMMERRKIRGGTPTLLTELGYPPRRCVDLVSARVPTQEQYEALQLPSDLPILHTLRVVYSDHDQPIEVTVMAKAGHLYELEYEFT